MTEATTTLTRAAIELTNSGESLAKDVRLKLLVIDAKTGKVSKLDLISILEKAPLSVSKGQKFAIPVMSNIELEKAVGYVPKSIRLYDVKTIDAAGPSAPVLNVLAEYTDIRLHPYVAAATAKLHRD